MFLYVASLPSWMATCMLSSDASERVRGVRLSVIERVEEVPALALFESAGAIQAQIGDAIFPVHAAALPEGHGTVKLLRLHDGRSVLCYPIRSEEHTSELQSLMRISSAVFCMNKNK